MSSSTVGADKSGATDKERFGPDSIAIVALCMLLVGVFLPVTVVMYSLVQFLGQLRRVRPSRMVAWWVASCALALVMVGFDPVGVLRHQLLAWRQTVFLLPWGIGDAVALALAKTDTAQLARPAVVSWPSVVWNSLPMALVVGVGLAVPRVAWATFRRRALTQLEDSRFDFMRPPGILDWVKRRRNIKRIEQGLGINRKRGTVALGTGYYGDIVNVPTAEFQRPTIVFGTIRSGKTVSASSMIAQAATGGIIVIDFKGDGDLPEFYGKWALSNGRKFKHFQMSDKGRVAYQPPVPGLPDKPACYDPLRHGNADSKTNMLQGSVPRDGDAAFYLRTASELTLVAYQVASVIGYDQGRSGFQTLFDMLDLGVLGEAIMANGPGGQLLFDRSNPVHRSLIARISALQDKNGKDEGFRTAVDGTRTLLSSYLSSAAVGPYLRPGDSRDNDINLVDAVLEGHVVVFSLPVQDYPELAKTMGTLVLLDMQNTISSLRSRKKANNGVMDWEPCYLQVEEFGSAGADAVLDVLNKSGDVGIRPWLSTQSWNDLLRMDKGESMASSIIDQAGNFFVFSTNDDIGAQKLAGITPDVTRHYPREQVKYSRMSKWSVNVRAANSGELDKITERETQLQPSDLKKLGKRRRYDNNRPDLERVYECVWIAAWDGKRITHTHPPQPLHWYEPVKTALVDPEAPAKLFPEQVHQPSQDQPLPSPLPSPIQPMTGPRTPIPVDDPAAPLPGQVPLPHMSGDVAVPDPQEVSGAGEVNPFHLPTMPVQTTPVAKPTQKLPARGEGAPSRGVASSPPRPAPKQKPPRKTPPPPPEPAQDPAPRPAWKGISFGSRPAISEPATHTVADMEQTRHTMSQDIPSDTPNQPAEQDH